MGNPFCPFCGYRLRKQDSILNPYHCDNCEYDGDGVDRDISGNPIEKKPWFMAPLKCDEGCDGTRCIDCKHNPASRRKRKYDRFRKSE